MNFVMEATRNSVPVGAHIDGDGDITLTIDGVSVLYISCGNGQVRPHFLYPEQAKLLRSHGFDLQTRGNGAILTRDEYWTKE